MSSPVADTPAGPDGESPPPTRARAKKWITFLARWTIAVVGIGWVIANTPLHDKVTLVDAQTMRPVKVTLAEELPDHATHARIIDPVTRETRTVARDELVNSPDTKTVRVRGAGGGEIRRKLLALDLSNDLQTVERFLVERPDDTGEWVPPDQVVKYQLGVPYPLVDQGLVPMIRHADRRFLFAAIIIFPVTYLVTGARWNLLLRAVDIPIGALKAFIINMVGAFYNTFLPGSTGGDALKAYYAARLAPGHRTRAVMSVIIDRVIGLVALIILGGTMAAYIALSSNDLSDPVARRCAQVAAGALAIIAAVVIGLTVFYVPALRRFTGLDFLLRRLPLQAQVVKAVDTMELYRRRPGLIVGTLLMTFPVHITVILSAMFAGMAFDLPLTPGYYWVVVPVVVLAGAVPISPQGAGVMEFFAILLTRKQDATVAEAFALTMSIRLVQIFWNLFGGIFVARGGYRAPTEKEQASIGGDDAEGGAAENGAGSVAPPPSSPGIEPV